MQSERLEQCPRDENKWSNPSQAPSIHDGEIRSFLSNRFDRDMTDFPADACLLEGVGLDSLDEFEMMAALENRFQVSFLPDHFDQPKTIGVIADVLEALNARVAS